MAQNSNWQAMERHQRALAELQWKDVGNEMLAHLEEEEKVYFEKSLYETLLTEKFKKMERIAKIQWKIDALEEEFIDMYADDLDRLDKKLESDSVLDEEEDDAEAATEEIISYNKIWTIDKLRKYKKMQIEIELERESLKLINDKIALINHKI